MLRIGSLLRRKPGGKSPFVKIFWGFSPTRRRASLWPPRGGRPGNVPSGSPPYEGGVRGLRAVAWGRFRGKSAGSGPPPPPPCRRQVNFVRRGAICNRNEIRDWNSRKERELQWTTGPVLPRNLPQIASSGLGSGRLGRANPLERNNAHGGPIGRSETRQFSRGPRGTTGTFPAGSPANGKPPVRRKLPVSSPAFP